MPTPAPTTGPGVADRRRDGRGRDGADGGDPDDVTHHHDDDGESGHANWWQVESLDGERLGRRELLHPHGTREFTRSETVAVPAGTACVVVRGHDETHGYGGRAALVVPDSGAVRFVDQGPESRAFAADCPRARGDHRTVAQSIGFDAGRRDGGRVHRSGNFKGRWLPVTVWPTSSTGTR